jgi:glycosyltransferase involved in cell wall biosynthesis
MTTTRRRRADLTVIIPCRNGAGFLPEALASVRAQSVEPGRCLVVDDGSTDGSAALAASAGFEVLRTHGTAAAGAGASAARNTGLAAAGSTYVAFLDADDWWGPSHLADGSALLDAHPAVALSFSAMRRTDTGAMTPLPGSRPIQEPFHAWPALLAANFIPESGVIVRTGLLREAGAFLPGQRMAEDYDAWLRLAQRHPFIHTGNVTAHYRVHPGQVSADTEAMGRAALAIRARHWSEIDARGVGAPEVRAQAMAGWNESLDGLWHHGHGAAYREWAERFATTFGEPPRGARLRSGSIGALQQLVRGLR